MISICRYRRVMCHLQNDNKIGQMGKNQRNQDIGTVRQDVKNKVMVNSKANVRAEFSYAAMKIIYVIVVWLRCILVVPADY